MTGSGSIQLLVVMGDNRISMEKTMNDVIDADDIAEALEKAIQALQRVAMAHPASDEHSRDMYMAADDARSGLVKILATYNKPATP